VVSAAQGAATGAHAPVTIAHAAPAKVEAVSGGGQSGVVGERLAAPLVVRALDRFDNPTFSSSDAVAFTTVTGGSIDASQVPIGADALASANATLGPTPGSYVFKASLGASEVAFEATAAAAPPPPSSPVVKSGGGCSSGSGSAAGAALPMLLLAVTALVRRLTRRTVN
jgi:hypothetical protein